jgi:hypothetical protein
MREPLDGTGVVFAVHSGEVLAGSVRVNHGRDDANCRLRLQERPDLQFSLMDCVPAGVTRALASRSTSRTSFSGGSTTATRAGSRLVRRLRHCQTEKRNAARALREDLAPGEEEEASQWTGAAPRRLDVWAWREEGGAGDSGP